MKHLGTHANNRAVAMQNTPSKSGLLHTFNIPDMICQHLLNMKVINLGLDDSLSFSYKNKKTYNIKNLENTLHTTRIL